MAIGQADETIKTDRMRLPPRMKAMVLEAPQTPLVEKNVSVPAAGPGQVVVRVRACGVCRTDLHVVDGELAGAKLPLIPGHEIIAEVVETGEGVSGLHRGETVGIPWLGFTCGICKYCLGGQENLCENARFTGYTLDGGYAEYAVAFAGYCFPLPPSFNDLSMAPLLCAGLIGYRSYRMIDPRAETIGFYGFGAAAHILIQIAIQQGKKVYAFTRDGDDAAQKMALKLGAVWAGGSGETAPDLLDAAIIFAPVGSLVPKALGDVDKAGSVICGGIHMSDIPSFPYELLWEERTLRSVANLTREDAASFLELVSHVPVHTETRFYPLSSANQALDDLRAGRISGAAVLTME